MYWCIGGCAMSNMVINTTWNEVKEETIHKCLKKLKLLMKTLIH